MGATARLRVLRDRLCAEHVDAIALTSVPNIAYCTAFPGVFDAEAAHIALVGQAGAVIFTDSRYYEALTTAAAGTEWEVRLVRESLADAVAEGLRGDATARVAVETSLPHARFVALAKALQAEVVEATGWVEALRAVKDSAELASIEAAQALTDRAFDHVLGSVRAGVTERTIALELEFFMRKQGSEGVAFPPIVASGPNSALPHAVPGDRVLADGDFVVLDFGARLGGYCADMTRTVVIGKATDRHREIYDAVLAANAAGTAAVLPGLSGRQIDSAARAVIAEHGFAEFFGHGLGHGVGLEIHEQPSIGPRAEGPVAAGAVITIEPGIYIPGFGGARIEDLAVVEVAGARVLTRSTKDLIEL